MRLLRSGLVATAAAALFSAPTLAADPGDQFLSFISAGQEVPPNGTSANGSGSIFIIDASTFRVNVNVTNLAATTTGAHVHVGPPGVNGAIIFGLNTGSVAPVITASTYTLTDSVFTSAAFVTALGSSTHYFNFHNGAANTSGFGPSTFAGGQARGNIVLAAVPEPGTIALMAGAALPLAGLFRRRRPGA